MNARLSMLVARLLIVGVAAMLVLAVTAPTAAAPPGPPTLTPPLPPNATDVRCATGGQGTVCHYQVVRAETLVPFFEEGVTCPGGGTILATYRAEVRASRWYDEGGQLTREMRHVRFTGTLDNPATGRSLPYAGRFTVTVDPAAGTVTITGHRYMVGGVVVDAGRVVYDLDTGEEVFKAGPGGEGEVLAAFCSLLR